MEAVAHLVRDDVFSVALLHLLHLSCEQDGVAQERVLVAAACKGMG
jgi:hypothetical protein